MIIHSPVISGSLTFAEGGTFTLPDNGVYSGSFSGSVNGIGDPETFSASLDSRLSGLTIDTGSQDGRLDNLETFSASEESKNSTLQTLTSSFDNRITDLESFSSSLEGGYVNQTELANATGALETADSSQQGRLDNVESFTSSIDTTIKTKLDVDGVVSGSSQVDLATVQGDTDDVTEGSTNLYYTDARVKTKLDSETVISGSSQVSYVDLLNIPSGIVSGSGQIITLVSIDEDNMASNSDTKVPTQQSVKAYVDSEVAGLVDSAPGTLDTLNELAAALGDDANFSTTISNQIGGKVSQSLEINSGDGLTGGGSLTTNRTLAVGQGDGISVSADAVAVDSTVLRTTGFGVVSGSSQIVYSDVSSIPGGIVSGSSQVDLATVQGDTDDVSEGSTNLYYTDARVKTKLDTEGVLSGSAQVSLSGFSTTDLSEGTNLYYTDARVKTKLDSEAVISGSSQVDLASVSNNSTTNVSEGTNLYYTDTRVKTKLDSETVVSGSGQILSLVSIDEDAMTSNSDTKLPTQQSVKAYVDTKVSNLVDSAPGTLDTLNELAAALGDDANFSTTISNQIAGKVSQSLEIGSGNGLTGGGNLTTNRTLAVGQGDGISVSADAVAVDSTVLRTTGFGVVSGSGQIDITGTTGTLDISSRTNLAVSDTTNVDMILSGDTLSANLKGGVVSGSGQIDITSTTGTLDISSRTNLAVSDTTNVDMILTGDTLSANLKGGVVSGSSQISFNGISDKPALISGSSQISHDSTTGFVSNEHIDHSTVSITAGSGLTGGGTIAANRTINVGAGDGISVSADAVAVDSTVLRTTGFGVVSGSSQIQAGSITGDIALGTQTSGNYVATLGTGTGVTIGSNTGEGSTPTISVDYGSTANTAVQGNTTISFGGTSGEISIDNGSSITLGSGGTVTIGLADTITGDRTFSNNVTITGNLTVNGTTTTVNSNTVNIGDNIIVLNSDETGTPSQNGGINIERGTSTNASLIWSEANDYWVAGIAGTEERIVVGAGNTSITTLGTITTGTWNGSVIASAYLDSDTAHLSGTQTFSGAKTFSSAVTISNSTASTSSTTGALKVTGGVGVGGDIFAGADIVAYASSDERLKDHIEPIKNPIGKVKKLRGVTWEWNENASEAAKQSPNVGVIAQDVETVLPQLVHDRENGYKGVDYSKLTGLLIEVVKEQQERIEKLEERLTNLEG